MVLCDAGWEENDHVEVAGCCFFGFGGRSGSKKYLWEFVWNKAQRTPENRARRGGIVRYKDVYPLYWKDIDCEPVQDTGR